MEMRMRALQKAYGAQPVLDSFSLTIQKGEAIALMGPSGGGKTTLTRLMMGLEKADGGVLQGFEGLLFSAVFQEDRLCENMGAQANVALVLPRAGWGSIPAALAAVGLAGETLQKPAGQLSGGEKRRVALVRAVQAAGDVLVLDEAFKGLDEASRKQAFEYVKQNRRGRTLVLVAHAAAEAEAFGARIVTVGKVPQ